jgi:hypothetical protein
METTAAVRRRHESQTAKSQPHEAKPNQGNCFAGLRLLVWQFVAWRIHGAKGHDRIILPFNTSRKQAPGICPMIA